MEMRAVINQHARQVGGDITDDDCEHMILKAQIIHDVFFHDSGTFFSPILRQWIGPRPLDFSNSMYPFNIFNEIMVLCDE